MKQSDIWNGNGRRLKLSTGQMSDVKTRENVNDYDMWACLALSSSEQQKYIIFSSFLTVYKRQTFILSPIILGD